MLNLLSQAAHALCNTFTKPLRALFSRPTVDAATLSELEKILIHADVGITTTSSIMDHVKKTVQHNHITTTSDLQLLLRDILVSLLGKQLYHESSHVYVLVGVNGSGKTTLASKLAWKHMQQKKRVLLVAADTFRAAAPEQLSIWAQKCNVEIVIGKPSQDPAAVVFVGCQKFVQEKFDVLIIDTAGRLQTKTNLMRELEKIRSVITKQLPQHQLTTLLTVDGMLGQNSLEQAKIFHASTPINGVVLTKMDGSGKGGIVFAISNTLHIPIAYMTTGEQKDALVPFDAKQFVNQILDL